MTNRATKHAINTTFRQSPHLETSTTLSNIRPYAGIENGVFTDNSARTARLNPAPWRGDQRN